MDDERPVIASVFYNRLKKGMPLQSDPTAVYDLEDFSGPITREHLRRESPYNTYVHKGLPPGPSAVRAKHPSGRLLTPPKPSISTL